MSSNLNASPAQFGKLIQRMMPKHISESGEGKLIAAILTQAWADSDKAASRRFFTESDSFLGAYADATGLNAAQLRELFAMHNGAYKSRIKELAA